MHIFDSILPVLKLAQAATAGSPAPDLENAINVVVPLAGTVSVREWMSVERQCCLKTFLLDNEGKRC